MIYLPSQRDAPAVTKDRVARFPNNLFSYFTFYTKEIPMSYTNKKVILRI